MQSHLDYLRSFYEKDFMTKIVDLMKDIKEQNKQEMNIIFLNTIN